MVEALVARTWQFEAEQSHEHGFLLPSSPFCDYYVRFVEPNVLGSHLEAGARLVIDTPALSVHLRFVGLVIVSIISWATR